MKELPKGWAWTTLGEVLAFQYGKSLPAGVRCGGPIPVMGSSGVIGTHNAALTETACIAIGRKGAAGAVHLCPGPCWPVDTVYFAYPPRGVAIEFLFHLLSSLQLRALDRSTAVPSVLRQDLEAVAVPLPPTAEQRRIVAEIEKLLTRLDDAITQAEFARRRLANFMLVVVREATTPKPHWRFVRAEEVCGFITKGTTPRSSDLLTNGDVPFLKVNNLTFGGPLDFSSSRTFVSRNTHERGLARSKVLPGDVLMNIVGPPLGKVALVPDVHPEYNINQAIARFRAKPGLDARYLSLLLQNPNVLNWAISRAKTTAGQVNLTLELCRDLPLPIAPEPEQQKIVAAIESAQTEGESAATVVKNTLARAGYLRQSILRAAFEGRLVPQDPNDEPASVLLERIKWERAQAGSRVPVRYAKKKMAAQ